MFLAEDLSLKWQLALSAYMTGLVFFVQICHYPLFESVDSQSFQSYHQRYVNRTSIPIALPMVFEMLLAFEWALSHSNFALVNLGLLILIWLVTFLWSVPCHNKLQSGFNTTAHKSLLHSNALRLLLWVLKTALLLWVL